MADDNEQSPPPPPGVHDLDKTGWTPETPAPPVPPVTHDLERTGYVPEAEVAPTPPGADKVLAVDDEIDNKYRIEELLGQGGMGAVYRVTELQTRERLALKTLNPELRGNPAAMADLAKEVATARQLSHDHLLRVYSMEAQGEFPYLVMEYVGGGDLDIRRKAVGGALAPDEAATRMVEVLGALGYLHNRSFVHRDVKPQNVLLTEAGHAKVTDFGISTSLKQASTAAVGTPRYMAPEQISGGEVTLKADIYAAGMMFYQLLTGTFPFGSGPDVTLEKVKAWHMAPTSLPDAPAPWRAVLEKAMAREPAARFKTAQEMADAITALAVGSEQTDSAPAASSNKGAFAVVAVVVAGLLGYIGLQGDDSPPPPQPAPPQAVVQAPAPVSEDSALKLVEAEKRAMELKLELETQKQNAARQAEKAKKDAEIAALQRQLDQRYQQEALPARTGGTASASGLGQVSSSKPWLVVACSSPKERANSRASAQRKIDKLQAAGFTSAKVVDGEQLSNFKCCFWSCVVDSFTTRAEAAALSKRVKAAGFSAYPKRGW